MLFISNSGFSQLVVDPNQNINLLVQKLLGCNKIKVSNVTFKGNSEMKAYFNSTNSNVGLKDGLLLSSGKATDAIGPNNDAGGQGVNYSVPGDVDLNALCPPYVTKDAAVLEFDFVPITDSVAIKYVFASEEYLEWVNSQFNDVFGFFLSGPGISGPYTNNAVNLAIVPNTNTVVSVNSINKNVNSGSYVDNGTGASGTSQYSNGFVNQFDGFTKPLIARHVVIPGQTYHIKLAVSDVQDAAYDSGVFIEAGSFFSNFYNRHEVATNPQLYEGCDSAIVNLQMTTNLYNIGKFPVLVAGTATNGVDYVLIDDSVAINPANGKGRIIITPINDHIPDDNQYVDLIFQKSACLLDTVRYFIRDLNPLVVTNYDTIYCGGPIVVNSKYSGGAMTVITWALDGSNNNSLAVNPGWNTTDYFYTVDDHCHQGPLQGKVRAVVNNKKPDAGPDQRYCSGLSANLGGATTAGYTYSWTPATSLSNPNSLQTTINLTNNGSTKLVTPYVVESDNGMCKAKDTAVVTVIPMPDAIIDPAPYSECPVFKVNPKNTSVAASDSSVWEWSTSNGQTVFGKDGILTFATAGTYDVFLKITNYGMCSDKDDALSHITIMPKPVADFTVDPSEVDMLYPTVNVVSNPIDADTTFLRIYSEKGDLVYEPRTNDFTYDIPTTGYNKVIQYVTAANGCKDTLEKTVYVKPEYFVYAPNAFTTNGDGLNEEYKVYYSWAIEDFNFYIFDRWGQELFHGTGNGREVVWDGKTKNGDLQPIGVYVTMYTYSKPSAGTYREKIQVLGTVTIIR